MTSRPEDQINRFLIDLSIPEIRVHGRATRSHFHECETYAQPRTAATRWAICDPSQPTPVRRHLCRKERRSARTKACRTLQNIGEVVKSKRLRLRWTIAALSGSSSRGLVQITAFRGLEPAHKLERHRTCRWPLERDECRHWGMLLPDGLIVIANRVDEEPLVVTKTDFHRLLHDREFRRRRHSGIAGFLPSSDAPSSNATTSPSRPL
jgi:hypothetical protein